MQELLSFEIIAFNADAFLEPVIKSLLPYAPIYIVEGPVKFWRDRGFTTSTDLTNQIIHDLLPEKNIAHGQFEEKDDEVNFIADRIKSKFIFAVDADEVWSPAAIEYIINLLKTDEYDSLGFRPFSFFGGFDRYMRGFEELWDWQRVQRWTGKWTTHRPPTVTAPDGKPWNQHRHLGNKDTWGKHGLRFFHYSYCLPRATFEKASYYTNAGTIPDWFNQVYLPWVSGSDAEKQGIENKFDGVHNWLASNRGPCRTEKFVGEHPKVIRDAMPRLKKRFDDELKQWTK